MVKGLIILFLITTACSTEDQSPAPDRSPDSSPPATSSSTPPESQIPAPGKTDQEEDQETGPDQTAHQDTEESSATGTDTTDTPLKPDQNQSPGSSDEPGRPQDPVTDQSDVPMMDGDKPEPPVTQPENSGSPTEQPNTPQLPDDGGNPDPEPVDQPGNDIPMEPEDPLTVKIQREVFDAHCVSCHSGLSPAASLDLTDISLFVKTAPNQLIMPGNPQRSGVFVVVNSGAMPPNGPLEDDLVSMLGKWIESLGGGAPDPGGPVISPGND